MGQCNERRAVARIDRERCLEQVVRGGQVAGAPCLLALLQQGGRAWVDLIVGLLALAGTGDCSERQRQRKGDRGETHNILQESWFLLV
jgi:hypothetical protein